MENEENKQEILSDVIVPTRNKGYYYFIDKQGRVARAKRKPKKTGKYKVVQSFRKVNITGPRFLADGYVSTKLKKVIKSGENSGAVLVPKHFIGKEFKVMLIPKEDWFFGEMGR